MMSCVQGKKLVNNTLLCKVDKGLLHQVKCSIKNETFHGAIYFENKLFKSSFHAKAFYDIIYRGVKWEGVGCCNINNVFI